MRRSLLEEEKEEEWTRKMRRKEEDLLLLPGGSGEGGGDGGRGVAQLAGRQLEQHLVHLGLHGLLHLLLVLQPLHRVVQHLLDDSRLQIIAIIIN